MPPLMPTFHDWKEEVCRHVEARLEITLNDVPDAMLQQWWEDSIPAMECVELICEYQFCQ